MPDKVSEPGTAQPGSMPPDIAARLAGIGRVIEVAQTNAIYAPLHPTEAYAGVTVMRDVAYGAHARHRLDIFAPDRIGGARAVLLFVHGGAYVRGDKHTPGGPFFDNIALWAVRHGMIGVTMNYRLAPQATWPSGAQDVGAAIAWLRANIGDHGGDASRLFALGSSAGANHVATYIAFPDLHQAGGVGLAGAILQSGSPFDTNVFDMTPYTDYFGADPARYPAQSPTPGLLKTPVPLMLVWAGLEPPGIERESVNLDAALRRTHRPVTTLVLKTHSHISAMNAIGTADTELTDQMLAFVKSATYQ